MTDKIKTILDDFIGQEQSSFVPGRNITNNVVIFQEALHSLHNRKGKVGSMVLKIDLEKAYNKLSWGFISDSLQATCFNHSWVTNIMKCVESPRLVVLWNRERLDWINPSRGIRQGDEISPYLFVICIERLSHIICNEVYKGA